MNSAPFPVDESLQSLLTQAGAIRWGVSDALSVDPYVDDTFSAWISRGCNAGMDYLDRYHDIRHDPRLLLEGTKSIISIAFPYWHPDAADSRIAAYALGSDYHEVLRRRLTPVADEITRRYGAQTRICIDTAPIHERYWALRSGVGFIGLNRQLIVPGAGSFCFLAEILSTARFAPTPSPPSTQCEKCRKCLRACPSGALSASGLDARRCISYLTIEHRGDFTPETDLHGRLYGCDKCALACPHNAHPAITTIDEFIPRPHIAALTPDDVLLLDQQAFSAIMRHSPIKRAKLAGLRRNALRLLRRD